MHLPWKKFPASRQIVIAGVLGAILFLASFAEDNWHHYREAVAESERSALSAARLLAEHTARTFEAADGALKAVERLHRDLENGLHDRIDTHRLLQAIHGGSPVFRAIGLIDRKGDRTASSLAADAPALNVSREEHFRVLRSDSGIRRTYVSAPTYSDNLASWIVTVGLRMETAEGEFDGIAGGVVDLGYFTRVFHAANLGPSAVVTLYRRDGTILLRHPEEPELRGTSLSGRRFMTEFVDRAPYGTFHAMGLGDGRERIVGYAVSPDDRFILTYEMRRADVLAGFWRSFWPGLLRVAGTLLAVAFGAWLLVRQVLGRERLALELHEEEAKLRDFAAASSDWFWETDDEHRFVWLSQAIERATGVPPARILGRRRLDLLARHRMPPDALDRHARILAERLPFRDFEYQMFGPEGERWIRTSGRPRFDADGRFMGYRGSARDVSELISVRQRLEEAIEAMPGDFLLFDADDRLVYKSSSPGRLPQMEGLERLGETFETILRRTVASGRVAEAVADPEGWIAARLQRHRQAAGSTLVHNSGRAIEILERPTADGGTMVLRFDVTEREETQRALDEARLAADAANRAKSDFLAGMSHELRTPLNAIIGFGQILQLSGQRGASPAQLREYSGYIVGSGEHLLGLVNDVLDMASVEAGRIRVSLEPVALEHVVDQVLRTSEPMAGKHSIELRSAVAADAPPVRADELRLQQVLLNLVSNAIKYNRTAGSVTVAAEIRGHRVRLTVSDTGPGVPSERVDQLFVPFQRLGAEFSTIEGTGIGLALSKRMVEAMGGSIGYRPETGGGSAFWIELPMAEASTDDRSPAGATASRAVSRAARGGYSVLYIEDNALNMRLMEYLLDTLPRVEMLSAPSGAIGIELAIARHPDVIVLDLNLPDMDGYRVLNALQMHIETRDVPVIALTASAMPADVHRGLGAGFRAYLTKPLNFVELLNAIDTALEPATQPDRAA